MLVLLGKATLLVRLFLGGRSNSFPELSCQSWVVFAVLFLQFITILCAIVYVQVNMAPIIGCYQFMLTDVASYNVECADHRKKPYKCTF